MTNIVFVSILTLTGTSKDFCSSEMGARNFYSQNIIDTLFTLCDGEAVSRMIDYSTTPCQNPGIVGITHRVAVTFHDVT